MELKITKKIPDFLKTTTNPIKKVVVVEFPNCISTKTNKSFEWVPTYSQLAEIRKWLEEIEKESWENRDRVLTDKEPDSKAAIKPE